ncbi:NADP-dependent isopropanol dehydrogenase [Methanobrevibacter curvatus]|uniref:NADP-dependent isopropanol dehydrogenase n=2 Tax=Methanobrevibacter curvatus TaxID=49547 RepID=A0A166DMC8_9EURY|nr:NADP-dependent isopropanol dehydrogenase [Methanobrevibacter curvatus]
MKKIGEIGWVEKDIPSIGPQDALLKPLAIAPCTSDVHTVWEGAIGERHDLILGHEAVGEVVEVGNLVKNIKVGDRVLVPAITPDWGSDAAQRGFSSQTGAPLGGWKYSNYKDGSMAEYFTCNEADFNLAILPENISPADGVMLVDMWSTGFMGAENANIPLGGSVAVLGIGAVGLSAILGAKLQGAGRIFAVGTRPVSVEVAKEYGATDIISYKDGDTGDQIKEATDGEGVDAVIVAGGGSDILIDAVKSARAGSVVSNINYFGEGENIPIPRTPWGFGMADIDIHTGLCPGGRTRMEQLANIVTYGRGDPSKLITHRFDALEDLEEALLLMKDKPRNLIKPVVILGD